MSNDQEFVELVAKVIDADRAKSELELIKATVKDLTEAEKDAMITARNTSREAARAQADHSGAVTEVKASYEQFNQIMEVANRVIGMMKAGLQAYLAVLRNVIEHSGALTHESELLADEWERVQRDFAEGVEQGGELQRAMRQLTGELEDAAPAVRALGSAFDYASGQAVDLASNVGGVTSALSLLAGSGGLANLFEALGAAQSLRQLLHGGEDLGPSGFTTAQEVGWAAALTESKAADEEAGRTASPEEQGRLWAQRRSAAEAARGRRNARISTSIGRGGGGGGGGGGEEQALRAAASAWQEYKRAIEEASEALSESATADETRLLEEQERVTRDLRDLEETRRQAAVLDREIEQDATAKRIEQHQRLIEMTQRLRDEEAAAAQARREHINQSINYIQSYMGAVVQIGSTFAGVFDRLASSEEEGSEAAEKYGKVKGGIMAGIAFVQSAIEWAKGFAYIADMQYGSAATAFVSAAAYDVAGAMALRDLGGSASPAAAVGGGASYVPEAPQEDRQSDQGTSGTNVVFYPFGMSASRSMQEYDKARKNLDRSGLDDPMGSAGEYR